MTRGKEPCWYLTPHGVQDCGDLRDMEDSEGRVVIECEDGRSLVLERVEFR